MAEPVKVVEGWTDELGPFTLLSDGVALDLTGKSVVFHLRDKNGVVVAFTGTTRIDGTPTSGKVYYKPTMTDLLSGKSPYEYHWQVTDGFSNVVFYPSATNGDKIVVNRQ
jgi:hypothetical protein